MSAQEQRGGKKPAATTSKKRGSEAGANGVAGSNPAPRAQADLRRIAQRALLT